MALNKREPEIPALTCSSIPVKYTRALNVARELRRLVGVIGGNANGEVTLD
jgi:hypothetical protein